MKTFSLDQACEQFRDIADMAANGRPVIVIKDAKLLIVQEYEVPDPIPMRPPGYFADDYTAEEIEQENRFAAHCPQHLVE